jgi:hypothetical protein
LKVVTSRRGLKGIIGDAGVLGTPYSRFGGALRVAL